MFKGHPKGLYVAFFANMGERFGFYTMMGILVYYLTAKYGLSPTRAGFIYSIFYASIYGLALVGGILADKTKNYKGVIFVGLITMLAGYALMALPGLGLAFTIFSLFVIAFGNGLFKGNLQAVVGQLYDNDEYGHLRDAAFSVFYMGINIGALFAPHVASGIINWFIHKQGYERNDLLPSLIHKFEEGTLSAIEKVDLQNLANQVSHTTVTDLATWTQQYLDVYSTGFNYAFGVAGLTMVASFIVYVIFKKMLPDVKKQIASGERVVELSKEETKQRLTVLFLVFAVVIFFWMSFHQNGLTMTLFAKDYTVQEVGKTPFLLFNVWSLVSMIIGFYGLITLLGKNSSKTSRIIGGLFFAGGVAATYYMYTTFEETNPFSPELFQPFNPAFIVILTPIVVGIFAWLHKRKKEPSTPKKIGIGMLLTSAAFLLLLIGSLNLPAFKELTPESPRVGVQWLIGTYFILTVAELFLSPMGLSFVSKVSPPKYQGIMQGAWLGTTAIGNLFLWVGSYFYERIQIWQVWLIFVILTLIAAGFIFSIMKKLEKVS
ncbi:MAG: peptide MFS transporter [Chlorobi bacterium]|nr:peptide MFS transporter [Chlorobiota bacterium]